MVKQVVKTSKKSVATVECPITRGEFAAAAETLTLKIGNDKGGGHEIANPRTFSSGSMGWYAGGKMLMPVNGKQVKCQVTCSIVIVGSKEAVGK